MQAPKTDKSPPASQLSINLVHALFNSATGPKGNGVGGCINGLLDLGQFALTVSTLSEKSVLAPLDPASAG